MTILERLQQQEVASGINSFHLLYKQSHENYHHKFHISSSLEAKLSSQRTDNSENKDDRNYLTGAKLLNPSNTPDFMLLPLELQGYCPWSLGE